MRRRYTAAGIGSGFPDLQRGGLRAQPRNLREAERELLVAAAVEVNLLYACQRTG